MTSLFQKPRKLPIYISYSVSTLSACRVLSGTRMRDNWRGLWVLVTIFPKNYQTEFYTFLCTSRNIYGFTAEQISIRFVKLDSVLVFYYRAGRHGALQKCFEPCHLRNVSHKCYLA